MSKHTTLILVACLLFTLHSVGQGKIRGSVKGILQDTAGKQSLSEATISLTPETDSTESEFALTDKHGAFSFHNLAPGNYGLLITFEGYHHIRKNFAINAVTKDID